MSEPAMPQPQTDNGYRSSATRHVHIPENVDPTLILGPVDSVLRAVEKAYPHLAFVVRGSVISIISHSAQDEPDAIEAVRLMHQLISAAQAHEPFSADSVKRMLTARPRADRSSETPREYHELAELKYSEHEHARTRAQRHAISDHRASHEIGHEKLHHPIEREQENTGNTNHQQHVHVTHSHQVDEPVRLSSAITFARGVPVRPKTAGQARYVQQIDRNIITFGIGPAGTGKTYLAVAKAVQAFEAHRVRRIILTRPAVEAGENLGFLPGTLNDKIDPYLRPLYDALSDMLGPEQMHHEIEEGAIEVAPLAYMRGRTLNDAFVILDEAQNTTEQQMKMFLTRLGFNTKMVVTGDSTQVDLAVRRSGLRTIRHILDGIDRIAFVQLTSADVVRHSLVGQIVEAYNRYSQSRQEAKHER